MLVDLPHLRTFLDLNYGTVFTSRNTNGEQYTAIKAFSWRPLNSSTGGHSHENNIVILSHTFDSPTKPYPLPTAYSALEFLLEGIIVKAHICSFRVQPEFIDLFGDKHPRPSTHDGCGYVYITRDTAYLCILDLSTEEAPKSRVALGGGMEQNGFPVTLLNLMTNEIVSSRSVSATISRITNTWSLVAGELVVFSHPNVESTC